MTGSRATVWAPGWKIAVALSVAHSKPIAWMAATRPRQERAWSSGDKSESWRVPGVVMALLSFHLLACSGPLAVAPTS